MSFSFMAGFMPYQSVYVCCGKIVLSRNRIFLSNIKPFFRNLFLYWVREIFLLYTKVFSETYNVNSFTMLWNSKVHSIYYLWIWYYIANFIQSI